MLLLQVGTAISVTHDRATQVGVTVRAAAEVTSVEGRRISFVVKAFDDTVGFAAVTPYKPLPHTQHLLALARFCDLSAGVRFGQGAVVGQGTHARAVVNSTRFLAALAANDGPTGRPGPN